MGKRKTSMTSDQVDFLSGKDVNEAKIQAAKDILLEAGYKVVKIGLITNVKTVKDLKDYFYSRLYQKYPEVCKNRVDNVQLDMRFANLFLESRLGMGTVGKAVALQECVEIIDVIFDYEDEFMFKYPITSISILGQGKLGWITQKAIEILNREKHKEMVKKSDRMLQEIEDSMEVDFNEKAQKMQRMLKRLEESNG